MFPRFSDIINYFTGSSFNWPIQTYGFFLALAFVTAGVVLKLELRRKEKDGLLSARTRISRSNTISGLAEFVAGTIFLSLFGWKAIGILVHYEQFSRNPQQFLISPQGNVTAAIIILLVLLIYRLYIIHKLKNKEVAETIEVIHPHQNTWNIVVVGLIFSLVGSKLFDIIDNFGSFLQNPVHSLLSFRGLTFYGGFIVTVIALMLYMRVIKLDWKHVIDSTAPAIMIGYAVGRLGCHFSGDGCWGIVNTAAIPQWLTWIPDWLWAYDFPHNVVNRGIPILNCTGSNCMVLDKPVFPTSLYESILAFASFGILWSVRKKIKTPVSIFGLFLILNGIERFFIEKIRINHQYNLFGLQLTQAEIISVLLVVAGIVILIYYGRKKTETIE